MKKIIFLFAALAGSFAMQAQGIDFGIKAGANFSNFSGDVDSDGITNFHAGAVLELNLVPSFSLQAEGLFSSQGGKTKFDEDGAVGVARDINLDYIAVPIMAKFYILPDRFSVMAGPQFSFLVSDADDVVDTKDYDLAAAGGVELKIIGGLFAQARYTVGLNNVSDNDTVDLKNNVFQLSVGYFF